jgi:DNA-directed RNA polymerase subunit F
MLFPHEFDRHRVMSFLLRQARESKEIVKSSGKRKKLTQSELAKSVSRRSKVGGVSQPTVSNLEGFDSLDRSFQKGNRPGTRETLIEIATLGLSLPQGDVDALLWLFEGERFRPLDEAEVRYCHHYDPQASPGTYSDTGLRLHVLELIDGWLIKRGVRSAREVQAQMITDWDETGQLEFREGLWRVEQGPGQRMMFGKYPSILTYPNSLRGADTAGHDLSLSDEGREAAASITDARRERFLTNLDNYGERCIHSTESLKRYLSSGFEHRLEWEQRREQVENLISLLNRHEHYEMALADVEPETEVEIKSTVSACQRATENDTYYWRDKPIICGPLYVYWYDVTTVFSFYRHFERAWDSIAERGRDKDSVIKFLRDALDSAR